MVAKPNPSVQAEVGKGDASLRERFMAWWEGYELDEPDAPRDAPVSEPEPESGVQHEIDEEGPRKHWDDSRLRLVQKLWGQGFSNPGGADHIQTMVNLFGLDPAMTVIELGAGLGGAARVMSKKFGVWVTGLEADEDLVEVGMALSVMAGMGEHVPIEIFDPDDLQAKPKSVDCVFSKEFLFTVRDKRKILKAVEALMKPRGQFLFTDYVLSEPHKSSPSLDSWKEREPVAPYPWALEDYQQELGGLHLEIRVSEDVTNNFRAMIIKGWAKYIGSTERGNITEKAAAVLVDEVEIWARRIQAIDDGDLKVYRVHAFKSESDGRMMSNW